MNSIREWIKRGVHKPEKSVPGLAKAITKALKLETPMHRGTIYKMIAGTRDIRADELIPISAYFGEPVSMPIQSSVGELVTIPIECEIGVRPGSWSESGVVSPIDLGVIVTQRDSEFPTATHRAFLFRGDSMMKSGLLDGDVVVCIEPVAGIADGGQVVIERTRAGLVELSVRVVNVYKDRTEYALSSDNEIYQAIVVRKM